MSTPFRLRDDKPKSQHASTVNQSKTQQQFADDANINNIAQRYFKTGVLSTMGRTSNVQPIFGDISSYDHEIMLNAVENVRQKFMGLRPSLRARFGSASNVLRFLEDPANHPEAVKIGLMKEVPKTVDPNQQDLVSQANVGAPKADPESQPNYQGGKPPA